MGERRLRRPPKCGFVLELERPEKGPVNASQRPDIEPQDGCRIPHLSAILRAVCYVGSIRWRPRGAPDVSKRRCWQLIASWVLEGCARAIRRWETDRHGIQTRGRPRHRRSGWFATPDRG